jgi:hypothetical protein
MRYVPGPRTYLPPQIQWQPTLTSHDPNPPIPIDSALTGAISGAVTQALAGVTQSSTGRLRLKANGSTALAAFTQSTATGRLKIKGQV